MLVELKQQFSECRDVDVVMDIGVKKGEAGVKYAGNKRKIHEPERA